jgi:hypothetical protein
MSVRATGGCLCGAVRYEVAGPLRDVVICHCARCRRTHGHVAAYASCAPADLRLVEEEGLRWYESDGRHQGFCGSCGSRLFWRAEGRDSVSITAGSIDEPTGLKTVKHIFTEQPGDYYEL